MSELHDHWTARHAKPVLFVILTLVAAGIYFGFSIPVAVFPETNFPRVVIGVEAPEIARADYSDADLVCHASIASPAR